MRQMVNGRLVEVRTGVNGSVSSNDIRRAAGIEPNRPLVLQLPDGSNRIINPGEEISIAPDQYFTHIPEHKRGGVGTTYTQGHVGLVTSAVGMRP